MKDDSIICEWDEDAEDYLPVDEELEDVVDRILGTETPEDEP